MLCGHASPLRFTQRQLRSPPLQVTRAFVNPYKVLQISEDADSKQIKRAYRKLALRHHPDINEDPSAEEDFLRIQRAYETLTNKDTSGQTDPKSNGWDFHDWYWDFTMSRRWDSHWKKTGRSGPSPFAATASHREQWAAQLTKLKQKAAYRRSQQQAQQSEQSWQQQHSQHPEQPWIEHHPQQAQQEQQQQQQQQQAGDTQQQHMQADQHDILHRQNSMHAQPHSVNAEASQQHEVPKSARHDQLDSLWHERNGPKRDEAATHNSRWTIRQQNRAASAERASSTRHTGFTHASGASVEVAHDLLGQAQARQTQLAQCVATHTSQWQDQLSQALSQLQVGPASAQAISTVPKPGKKDSPTTNHDISSGNEAAHGHDAASAPLQELHNITEQSLTQEPLTSAEQSSKEHHAEANSAANDAAEAAENSGHTQPDFQTPQSRVQSQLAGLKRRAARKQAQ